jgi:hypothetical protein
MKYQKTLIVLSLIASFIPTIATALPIQISQILNSQKPELSKTNKSFSISFRPPKNSQPRYTVGGAVRGNSCAIDRDSSEMTAIVPEKDESLTLQSHPNFFAYVSPLNGEKLAILTVKDETENYYYSQKLMIPAAGGVIKMTLAEDAPPLKVGQSYSWFLRLQCNAHLEPEDPQISASITRVEGNIPSVNGDDLVLFYIDSQIWYDSLNTAFALSQSGKDIYWSELLNSVGMDKFVTAIN